ncbi:hypothetical protein BHE74_00014350 [Ensete ventricosum]|nr:hypothetical protein GW17_00010546 [Ensete ventricosum]RWW77492.1 hypothetical protein BHE74_00014350 [Ensete ventricosum]RZR84458.1 hypothetical protein BHM03_00011296 [Ensete ventricosum]
MDRLTSTALLPESFQEGTRDDIAGQMGMVWQQIKAPVIVPLLRLAVFLCLVMSVMLVVEKVYMAVVIVLIKLFGRRPEKRYKWEPMRDDLELGSSAYPMVLVQIPMYNEKEVPFPLALSSPQCALGSLLLRCSGTQMQLCRSTSSPSELHAASLGHRIES